MSNFFVLFLTLGFCPSRTEVDYLTPAQGMEDAPIEELKFQLSFIANQKNWGMYLPYSGPPIHLLFLSIFPSLFPFTFSSSPRLLGSSVDQHDRVTILRFLPLLYLYHSIILYISFFFTSPASSTLSTFVDFF